MRTKGQRFSTVANKVIWLLSHQDMWLGDKKEIVELMREEKIISPLTYWKDVNIRTLIAEAQKLKRQKYIKSIKQDEQRRIDMSRDLDNKISIIVEGTINAYEIKSGIGTDLPFVLTQMVAAILEELAISLTINKEKKI